MLFGGIARNHERGHIADQTRRCIGVVGKRLAAGHIQHVGFGHAIDGRVIVHNQGCRASETARQSRVASVELGKAIAICGCRCSQIEACAQVPACDGWNPVHGDLVDIGGAAIALIGKQKEGVRIAVHDGVLDDIAVVGGNALVGCDKNHHVVFGAIRSAHVCGSQRRSGQLHPGDICHVHCSNHPLHLRFGGKQVVQASVAHTAAGVGIAQHQHFLDLSMRRSSRQHQQQHCHGEYGEHAANCGDCRHTRSILCLGPRWPVRSEIPPQSKLQSLNCINALEISSVLN